MNDTKPNRLRSIQRTSCPRHHRKTIKHIKVLVLVTSLLALSLTVFGCGGGGGSGGGSVEASSDPAGTNGWNLSYQAGYYDAGGKYAGGTDIILIVPRNGKLYAAVGNRGDAGNASAQILRLDAPGGQWQVDLDMGPQYNIPGLQSVTFTTDSNGNPLAQPVNLLVAGNWLNNYTPNGAMATLFVRDDATGTWQSIRVTGGAPTDGEEQLECRYINMHRDSVTGVDRIFFDVGTKGIWSGVYDPSQPGQISMGPYPETQGVYLPVRVLGMVEANNSLLFSSGPYIYRRNDGASPSYTLVGGASDLDQTVAMANGNDGIRGMTTIPNPQGTGDSILFAWMDCIYRLDPDGHGGYTRNSEACLANSAESYEAYLGYTASIVWAALSDMLPVVDPGTSKTVYIIGLEAAGAAPPPYPAALYAIRDAVGSYRVRQVDPGSTMDLRVPRTYALSPFPQDNGASIYFGGFDDGGFPAHNTAWVFQTTVENALK
jgi:hypothetical protein